MNQASLINETIESRKSKLIGRSSYNYMIGVLNRAFRQKDPYIFKYELRSEYRKGDFSVSGLYDIVKDKKYIILNFPKSCTLFDVTEQNWQIFKFAISQVCQHETIHQLQWRRRGPDSDRKPPVEFCSEDMKDMESKEYLSDVDEIDAYAHDIAMEIKYFYPNKNPEQILSNINRYKKLWSYSYYRHTFQNSEWSNIQNRLLKKTYQWLPRTHV